MKSLADVLAWVVGGVAGIFAIYKMTLFVTARDAAGIPDMAAGLHHLWWAIAAAIVTIACVVIIFVRHPRVEEEIHITK